MFFARANMYLQFYNRIQHGEHYCCVVVFRFMFNFSARKYCKFCNGDKHIFKKAKVIAKCYYNLCKSRTKTKKVAKPRRLWLRPGRTSTWWDNMLNGVCPDSERKDNFRMSRCNFEELCDDLRPLLERHTTRMRKPLSVETQVAVTLYYLADEGRYRKVANAFGVSRSSVSIAVRKVCESITEYLGPLYYRIS
jgi:hypothetical protein